MLLRILGPVMATASLFGIVGQVSTPPVKAFDDGPAKVTAETVQPAQVKKAIDNAVDYLTKNQNGDNWEAKGPAFGTRFKGGVTCLALLALLEAGGDPVNDAVIKQGLRWLRKQSPSDIYVLSLQTMVYARANLEEDRTRIKDNVDNLVKSMKFVGGGKQFTGFGYDVQGNGPGGNQDPKYGGDNSNSQYGVLALHFASEAGISIDDQTWKAIQEMYKSSQNDNGGWRYRNDIRGDERLTMTTAGVGGLLITGMKLYKNEEKIDLDGKIDGCGNRKQDKELAKGLERIAQLWSLAPRQGWHYYNLYGIERAGRLAGVRFFVNPNGGAPIDWYREGAASLVNTQNVNGSWGSGSSDIIDHNPIVATSFSLLFLSKGRTPVLIHKMVHGDPQKRGARQLNGDWNNDPNDARNLTDFCSKQVFIKDKKAVPLTWQVFDATYVRGENDPNAINDMLQAPIIYFNGHDAPKFTEKEKKLLQRYVEEGGFIIAEACCGREEFNQGFRKLCQDLWPKNPLAPLEKGDPIWTAAFPLLDKNGNPMNSFDLHGIKFGCRTGLVYSPKDMSCHWESNKLEGPDPRTLLAFRTGANIIAYATGLEPPRDKLEKMAAPKPRETVATRCFLELAQINHGSPDWRPAPRAMQVVKEHLHEEWKIDVVFQKSNETGTPAPTTEARLALDKELARFKFLYIHGRGEIKIPDEHKRNLREHLRGGAGFLFVDAACGDEKFHKSFLEFAKSTFPDEPLEDIPEDDPLFSDDIGLPKEAFKYMKLRTEKGKPYQSAFPKLQGIRLDPKKKDSPWILIYSRYDVGCALEKHTASDCIGYDHDSALKLTAQIMLYGLKR